MASESSLLTLEGFFNSRERETWQGLITAYRNGAKYRLVQRDSGDCPYIMRADFQEAWLRGYEAMEAFLASGGVILDQEVVIASKRKATTFRRTKEGAYAAEAWERGEEER